MLPIALLSNHLSSFGQTIHKYIRMSLLLLGSMLIKIKYELQG